LKKVFVRFFWKNSGKIREKIFEFFCGISKKKSGSEKKNFQIFYLQDFPENFRTQLNGFSKN